MPKLNALPRYWHTLRHLKPVQFYGRLWFRLARPKPDLSAAPGIRAPSGDWQGVAKRSPSMTGPADFIFLNVSGSLDREGWDDPALPKLWRYNQHYFDDLNAQEAAERRKWHDSFIERWIGDNTPGKGSGWEPYPTSIRIVNWIKMALSGHDLSSEAVHSLAVQARWLRNRLEWHLLGNHLFVNAKALMFAGLFFEGPETQGWRRTAARILSKEIPEQILPDGGQFELSPMYQALAFEDLLDLVNIWNAYKDSLTEKERELTKTSQRLIPKMQRWLNVMSHPDDRISFFNDAAFGIAPETSELRAFSARLGFAPTPPLATSPNLIRLEHSGYARLNHGPVTLLADVASVGPDYLPGHAHADTLSFELSVFGQRVFVNSGTSEYCNGTERHRQRSTAAHNTVEVTEENSSEVWAGFRVARRARIQSTQCGTNELEAQHDGYTRLPTPTLHGRKWLIESNTLSVTDTINTNLVSKIYFHVHPDVQIEALGDNFGKLLLPTGQDLHFESTALTMEVNPGTWHPYFGKSIPNKHLTMPLNGGKHTFRLRWNREK